MLFTRLKKASSRVHRELEKLENVEKQRWGFLWWELVLMAVQIAFIALVGVVFWLIFLEE